MNLLIFLYSFMIFYGFCFSLLLLLLLLGDQWPMTGDRWPLTGGCWPVTGDWWPVTTGRCLVTGDRWSMTGDQWLATSDFCLWVQSWVWVCEYVGEVGRVRYYIWFCHFLKTVSLIKNRLYRFWHIMPFWANDALLSESDLARWVLNITLQVQPCVLQWTSAVCA